MKEKQIFNQVNKLKVNFFGVPNIHKNVLSCKNPITRLEMKLFWVEKEA